MNKLKWISVGIVGSLFAVSHIGMIGYIATREKEAPLPSVDLPVGPYTSYKVSVSDEGYAISYKANDPKVLESSRSLDLNKSQSGFFGGKKYEDRKETRYDQYTMEGVRNMGGASGEGKSASDIECIVADAGARSQGAMAGTAISTGLLAPAVMNIPYIGWLAAGWANLLGQKAGSSAGSLVNSAISDC